MNRASCKGYMYVRIKRVILLYFFQNYIFYCNENSSIKNNKKT